MTAITLKALLAACHVVLGNDTYYDVFFLFHSDNNFLCSLKVKWKLRFPHIQTVEINNKMNTGEVPEDIWLNCCI